VTINVRLRKNSVTVVTESVIVTALSAREPGETINVDVHPNATLIVAEDGATPEELDALARRTESPNPGKSPA
jgi:hypothetical protein